ncbi:MAG: hypothetical protein WDZ40_00860 [Candidatus Spechtbacterales bacterium]
MKFLEKKKIKNAFKEYKRLKAKFPHLSERELGEQVFVARLLRTQKSKFKIRSYQDAADIAKKLLPEDLQTIEDIIIFILMREKRGYGEKSLSKIMKSSDEASKNRKELRERESKRLKKK